MKLTIEIPDKYKAFLEFLKTELNMDIKKVIENVIRTELESRIKDLELILTPKEA